MNGLKDFLCENMPARFDVRFTLVRKNQKALIAGEIVMCDAAGTVIEKSDMLYLSPKQLYQAADGMNCLRPDKEEFLTALEIVLGKDVIKK